MKLPDDVQEELNKVLQDPLKFVKLLKIQDKYSGKLVRFSPNSEQEELIKKLQQHQKIIILKQTN